MPLGFTHLFVGWMGGQFYESVSRKKILPPIYGFLVFFAIAPDMDFLFEWTTGIKIHRLFSHSLFFACACFALVSFLARIGALRFFKVEGSDSYRAGIAAGAGVLLHLLADLTIVPGSMVLFWPLPYWVTIYGVVPNHVAKGISFSRVEAVFDFGVGTAWMFFLWFKGKLQF